MQSMTGFARAEGEAQGYRFSLEVKSVNHRFLDVRVRLPGTLALLELAVAERVRAHFERGSIEIFFRTPVTETGPSLTRFALDETAVQSLIEACDRLEFQYKISGKPTLELMALTQKVFVAQEVGQDPMALMSGINPVLEKLLTELKKMRESEGKRLKESMQKELDGMKELVTKLVTLVPEQRKRTEKKIKERVAQWNLGTPVDAQRLEWEIAFYADRGDVQEELDRLGSHLVEFEKTMGQKGKGIGKKLDFLTQELHRELNTLGTKSQWIELTQIAVEGKALVERLREQVQNVE